MTTKKRGRIAFITTPKYRKQSEEKARGFIYRHFFSLCKHFEVLHTGRTHDFVKKTVRRPFKKITAEQRRGISKDCGLRIRAAADLSPWRKTVSSSIRCVKPSIMGMIELANELVEERLDAVIHLTDWDDVTGKADSMVIRREANVHNVPIASDIYAAETAARVWIARAESRTWPEPVFLPREPVMPVPLEQLQEGLRELKERDGKDGVVLAMIAHDNMKLDLCEFAVRYAEHIFREFDFVLTTGTTGKWLLRFFSACGQEALAKQKIIRCLSGPKGGDVQIAYAAVEGLCRKVIFFQDPFTSHPHETDIRLFEQAVIAKDIEVELAENPESAKVLLGLKL